MSRRRTSSRVRQKKNPSRPIDLRRSASSHERSVKATSYTPQQITRALSFVDISGDDKITGSELRGSLLSTSMHASHSNKLAELLLGDTYHAYDGNDINININVVRSRLERLITNGDDDESRSLAERAIGHLLKQREDENSTFEWKRAFLGSCVFLVPCLGVIMGKCGCFLGPETNTLFIPTIYLDYDHRSHPGWKLQQQKKLMLALQKYTEEHEDNAESGSYLNSGTVEFQTTVIVFRLGKKTHSGLHDDEVTTIRFGRDKHTVRLKATGKTHVRTVTVFAEALSCEDFAVQARTRRGFPKGGLVVRYDPTDQKNKNMTFDLFMQQQVQQKLEETLCGENDPIAEFVAVWEVRMRCTSKHIRSRTLHGGESTSSNAMDIDMSSVTDDTDETLFQKNLKGAEIVYQHSPSQTVEFHTAESKCLDYSAENLAVVDDVERIQSEITQIAYKNVRETGWCRIFLQINLMFFALIFIVIVAVLERYYISKDLYKCVMAGTDEMCRDDFRDERVYTSLVTSAEIMRIVYMYLFMGILSSIKNTWFFVTQRTRVARQHTKDDVYMSTFEAIARLPRPGMHHTLVGQTAPYLFAFVFMCLPFGARFFKTYRNLYNDKKNILKLNMTSQKMIGAAFAGEVNNMEEWQRIDIILSSICLTGFSVMLVSVIHRLISPCCGSAWKRFTGRSAVIFKAWLTAVVTTCLPILLFYAMGGVLRGGGDVLGGGGEKGGGGDTGEMNGTKIGQSTTMVISNDIEIIWWALITPLAALFVLKFIIYDKDGHHEYNDINQILVGPLFSLISICIASYCFSMDIHCIRLVLMFASACVCYVQSVNLLAVLHRTYSKFEHLTKLMELFTTASNHSSWYRFFRSFARSRYRTKKRNLSHRLGLHLCCECCVEDIERNRHDSMMNYHQPSSHERVVDRIRHGPSDRNGVKQNNLEFTAFDLTVTEDIINWNDTRTRLMATCNSTETEVLTVNLQFILSMSVFLFVLVFLKMVQQHGKKNNMEALLARNDTFIAMVDDRISNSTLINMFAMLFVTMLCTLPTWYQRQKLAAIQNSHLALLAEMKHSVVMLNVAADNEELESVINLLEKTAEKIDASDKKPMVFGIEVEAWNSRSALGVLSSLFFTWLYLDQGWSLNS